MKCPICKNEMVFIDSDNSNVAICKNCRHIESLFPSEITNEDVLLSQLSKEEKEEYLRILRDE